MHVTGLKATFTPSDDDQLPLSTKYRDSLRKLCTIIKERGKLPQNYQDKEQIIRKQCQKLESDDKMTVGLFGSGSPSGKSVIFGLALASVAGVLIINKVHDYQSLLAFFHSIEAFLRNMWRKWNGKSSDAHRRPLGQSDVDDKAKIDAAREARLKRFTSTPES